MLKQRYEKTSAFLKCMKNIIWYSVWANSKNKQKCVFLKAYIDEGHFKLNIIKKSTVGYKKDNNTNLKKQVKEQEDRVVALNGIQLNSNHVVPLYNAIYL